MNRTTLQTMLWLFLGLKGRVGRRAYFLAGVLLLVVQLFLLHRFVMAPEGSQQGETWALMFMLAAIASVISNIALTAKRLQDIDRPPLLAAFYLLAGFFMWVFLCFVPGTPGPNRYGPVSDRPV